MIETDHYKLVTFDRENENHRKALEALEKDQVVQKYLNNVGKFLTHGETYDELDGAYLVGKDDEIIGYINLLNYGEIEEMHYAVLKDYRGIRDNSNETVGCKIVKELSTKLLNTYKNIIYLRLFIEASNIRSIKTAQNAGFVDSGKLLYNALEYRKYNK